MSTIKHAHHGLELDRPGKDSFRHREAGAEEVLVVGGQRWALLRETAEPPSLAHLAARLQPVDLVLVEGFKSEAIPQVEVHRPALGKPPLWPGSGNIVAVASDVLLDCAVPVLPLDDPASVAGWIVRKNGLFC